MTHNLRIETYVSTDPNVPASRRAAAFIFEANGKRLPVSLFGESEEDVREKTSKWLDEEIAKRTTPDGRSKEGRERRAAEKAEREARGEAAPEPVSKALVIDGRVVDGRTKEGRELRAKMKAEAAGA